MLKINKRASDKLIKEYNVNALDYFDEKIKKEKINISFEQHKNNIINLLVNIDFMNIYKKILSNINNIYELFTYIKHHKNDTTTEESIYDNFRTKTLLKYNKKKNREIKINTPNKEIDESNKKVAKLHKDFIKELDIKVCPYCGRNHIGYLELKDNDCSDNNNIEALEAKEIDDDKTVTIVPSLDHFYPKSLYRQFSISLYNLIPACNLCNLTLKHDHNETNLLFPYKEGFEDYVKFNLGDNSEDNLMKVVMLLTGDSAVDTSDLDIKLVKDLEKINKKIPLSANADIPLYKRGCLADDGFLDRCKNSNRMFHIEEIYNSEHKQNALDLISKIVWYRKNYFKSLINLLSLKEFSNLIEHSYINNQVFSFICYFYSIRKMLKEKFSKDIDIADFLGKNFDFLFGRWLDPENDLKEPLSKFYRDIYKQIMEPHLYEPLEEEKVK